jgi:hypothetical protein
MPPIAPPAPYELISYSECGKSLLLIKVRECGTGYAGTGGETIQYGLAMAILRYNDIALL